MKIFDKARGLVFGAAMMAPAMAFSQEGPEDGPPPLSPAMEALDTNRDGQVSADELKNAAESLGKLDHNKDGILDRSELEGPPEGRAGGPPPPPRGPGGPPPEGRAGGPPRRGPGGPPEGRGPGRAGGQRGGPGGPPRGAAQPQGGPAIGRVLPPFARNTLSLNADQIEKVDALEKEVKGKLESILTHEQMKQLQDEMEARRGAGPGGAGGRRGPGGPPLEDEDGPPRGGRPGGPPPRR